MFLHQPPSPVTVTQAIEIACPVAKAFDFMSDAPQWLPWAMLQVESVQPLPFGQWLVKTPTGLAKLRTRYDATQGAAQCELLSGAVAAWQVPVQMLPTAAGCQLAVTFTKPEQLNLAAFEASLQHAAQELRTLKLVLEQD